MSLASTKVYGLLYTSSTILDTASSDPPNKSIDAVLFLLMKIKTESISTERLARRYAVQIPSSERSLLFSACKGGME